MDTSDRLLWIAARLYRIPGDLNKTLSWLLLFQREGMIDDANKVLLEVLRDINLR